MSAPFFFWSHSSCCFRASTGGRMNHDIVAALHVAHKPFRTRRLHLPAFSSCKPDKAQEHIGASKKSHCHYSCEGPVFSMLLHLCNHVGFTLESTHAKSSNAFEDSRPDILFKERSLGAANNSLSPATKHSRLFFFGRSHPKKFEPQGSNCNP